MAFDSYSTSDRCPEEVDGVSTTAERIDHRPRTGRTIALIIALLISLGCLLYGFTTKYVDVPYLWHPEGLRKLEQFSALYWTVFFAVWSFWKRLVRPVILAAAIGMTFAVAGPWIVFSVSLFFLGCWAIGALLFPNGEASSKPDEMDLLRLCAGLAVLVTFLYAAARVNVYYPAVFLVLLAAPIFFQWRRTWFLLSHLANCCLAGRGNRWEIFTESLLGFVLFCSLLLALSPEVGTDALAMHLAVAADMAIHHHFTYTPMVISWSVMPMGADFCFAVAYTFGGEMAARLQNFGFLIFLLAVLFCIGLRLTNRRADVYLVLAMFTSCSLVQFVVDSIMVENLWGLLCAGLVLTVLKYRESGRNRLLILYAMLGGGAMMIKLGSLAFLFASLPFLVYAVWRGAHCNGFRRSYLLAGAAVLLLMASIPYGIAFAETGNPVFPFENAVWKSSLFDTSTNLVDLRWRAPIRSTLLFDLTFKTGKYLESRAGGIGYTWLLFALPCLATISRKWKFATIVCLGAPLVFFVFTFHEVRYLRYLYPGLAILSLLMVYPLGEAWRLHRGLYLALAAVGVAGTGLNYYYSPVVSEQQSAFYSFTPNSREQYMLEYGRPVPAVAYLNRTAPGAAALFIDTYDIAGLIGQPYALTWHFYPLTMAIRNAYTLSEMRKILADHSIQYIVHSVVPQMKWPVQILPDTFLQTCTTPVFQAKGWEVRKIKPSGSASGCDGSQQK